MHFCQLCGLRLRQPHTVHGASSNLAATMALSKCPSHIEILFEEQLGSLAKQMASKTESTDETAEQAMDAITEAVANGLETALAKTPAISPAEGFRIVNTILRSSLNMVQRSKLLTMFRI